MHSMTPSTRGEHGSARHQQVSAVPGCKLQLSEAVRTLMEVFRRKRRPQPERANAIECAPITIAFPSALSHHSHVKVRAVIRLIEDDGWCLVRTRGSHRQYKHASKPGLVTIAGNLQDDVAPGTLNSILKQAGLKK
jgi:predicted RNA binding protein YcfA (HicA-like mRNA interferase family)